MFRPDRRPLGAHALVIAGQSPEGKFYNQVGDGLPFYQGKKDFGDRELMPPTSWTTQTTKEALAGDILMSVRAPVGPINFAKERVCIGRGLAAIRSRDGLDRDFLFYQLLGMQKEIAGKEGAVFASINKAEIQALPIHVPSLPEQRRIVAILDEAFEGIANANAKAEKNLNSAREVFESHLASVFSARNEGWADKQLHSICQRITVGHVGSMASLYKPAGIPFLRSQNIRPFSVSMQNLVFIDEEFHAVLGKSSLQAGDVAIVRTGYPGTAAVIPSSLGVANCSDLVIVRPGPEIDAHFLCAFFNSAFGKSMVSGKVVGAAQKHFNVGAAKDVLLHLPPLAEQQAIVVKADELRDETDRLEGLLRAQACRA